MYPRITCTSCGHELGGTKPIMYRIALQQRLAKYDNKYMYALAKDVKIDMSDVLTRIHITKMCCRTRFLTNIEFNKFL
jgi:DNA-directed RNA polymerase subunit N (RpoN/RPB10)